jgi:hypothetical protein
MCHSEVMLIHEASKTPISWSLIQEATCPQQQQKTFVLSENPHFVKRVVIIKQAQSKRNPTSSDSKSKGKVKVCLSLCLNKHNAIKTYGGVEE